MATTRTPLHSGACECNRPVGECIKGDMDDCPAWYEDPDVATCPKCGGMGSVPCYCGGDLCVCENYGEKDCALCGGEGDVTGEVHDRYVKAEAEGIRQMRALWAEIEKSK